MDEAVRADVDADVRERVLERVKEDQIARLQLLALDCDQPGRGRLLVGAARQHHAEAHLEDVAREATAVEARLGRHAAAPIADPDEVERGNCHLGRPVAHLVEQPGRGGTGLGSGRGRLEQASVGEQLEDWISRLVGGGERGRRCRSEADDQRDRDAVEAAARRTGRNSHRGAA